MSSAYFITDNRNFGLASIRYIDASGIISTPPLDGSADPEYSYQGGIACPWGCVLNPSGTTLYVVDECARVVYGIDTTTFIVTRVAGHGHTGGSGALGWNFGDPYEVTCDANGNLAVMDPTEVVGVNLSATSQVMCGVTIASGDAAVIAGNPLGYNTSYGIVFDTAGNLYATDQGNTVPAGNVVRKIDAVTGTPTIIAGQYGVYTNTGDGGPASASTLDSPFQISLDKNGILYVISNGLNGGSTARIRIINTSGTTQTVCGVTIASGNIETLYIFSGNPNPWYTQPDNQGNLYVCTVFPRNAGCWVHLLTSSGAYNVVAGTSVCGFAGDGGPATSALIGEAFAVAVVQPSLCGAPPPLGNPYLS